MDRPSSLPSHPVSLQIAVCCGVLALALWGGTHAVMLCADVLGRAARGVLESSAEAVREGR